MIALRPISHRAAVALVLAAAVVLLLPVAAVYTKAILASDTSAESTLFDLERQWPLLLRSLSVAGGAAALALVLGVVVGLAASRSRPWARTALGCACAVSLLTPPYVFVVAWIDLWGPAGWLFRWAPQDVPTPGSVVYGVPGAIAALAAAYYPIVAFAAYTGFRRLDRRWAEAASVAGRTRGFFQHIALPMIAKPIGAGALAVFLLALYDFPVHSLLQVNTYLVEMNAAAEYHDYRAATLLSLPLVGIAAITIASASVLLRRYGRHFDAGFAARTNTTSSPSSIVVKAFAWCLVVFAGILPIIAVTERALPAGNFVNLFETAWQELFWSALLALLACEIIALLGIISAVAFGRSRLRGVADVLAALPFLISGPLLGLGLIAVFNRPGIPGLIYDSKAMLLIAWTARYVFLAQWGIGAAVRNQSPSLSEAARVSGVSWLRTQLAVTVPLAMPYIALVSGAAFVLCFREIDAAVMVAPPGTTLASVRLFTLMHYGPDGYVMAMALSMTAIALASGAIFYYAAASWKRLTDARAH